MYLKKIFYKVNIKYTWTLINFPCSCCVISNVVILLQRSINVLLSKVSSRNAIYFFIVCQSNESSHPRSLWDLLYYPRNPRELLPPVVKSSASISTSGLQKNGKHERCVAAQHWEIIYERGAVLCAQTWCRDLSWKVAVLVGTAGSFPPWFTGEHNVGCSVWLGDYLLRIIETKNAGYAEHP